MTLTMRPHFWPIMSWTRARESALGALVWHVGARIAFDKVPTAKSQWYTIIGVVASEHVDALDVAPVTEAYHSSVQEPATGSGLAKILRQPAKR